MQAPEIVFLHSGAVGCLHFTCAHDMCIVMCNSHVHPQRNWRLLTRNVGRLRFGGVRTSHLAEPRLNGRSRALPAEPGSALGSSRAFGLLPRGRNGCAGSLFSPATSPPLKSTFKLACGHGERGKTNLAQTAVTALKTRPSARFICSVAPPR